MKSLYRILALLLAGFFFSASAVRAAEFAVATDGGGYVDATLGGGAALSDNWSFSAWVYFTEGGSYAEGDSPLAVVTSQQDIATGLSAEVLIDGDVDGVQHLELGRSNGYVGEHSTLPIPTNQWTHIAITVSSSKVVRYFINGAAAGVFATEYASRNVSLGHVGSGLIRFMGNHPFGRKFKGGLDDVQIWNTERSAAEILAAMSTPPVGSEPNLVAWYRLNEGTGNSAANGDTLNASGPATLVNVVTWVPGVSGSLVLNANDSEAGSLRQVIASAASGGTLTFAPYLSGQTILLTSGQLLLDKNLIIDGSTLPGGIQINGNATSRVFYVNSGVATVLKSLTIANGLAPEGIFAANGGGGGIFSRGRVDLLNCSIVSNSVAAGGSSYAGGIACDGGDVRLTNSTVAFNRALTGSFSQGGAFYNYLGTLIFDQCTVVSNQAADTSGGVAQGGSTTLRATVFSNGNTDFYNFSGGASLGNNFIADGTSSGLTHGVNGDLVGTSGSPLNPLLSPLGNYGGPTPTLRPLPDSPVIDTGGASASATDQRGLARVVGPFSDIGAVEFQDASPVVTTSGDSGLGSLRFTITYSTNGSTITFTNTLSGDTIPLTSGQLLLNKNLTIDGSALAGGITISGNQASRIFGVTNGSAVTLNSLTLANGRAVGAFPEYNGGAIYNYSGGTLTLNNCLLTNNSGNFGAAIENQGALHIHRSTFAGNSADAGGGAVDSFGIGSSMTAANSTFLGNSAPFYGGAIFLNASTATIIHCTISSNSCVNGEGGGIDLISGSALFLTNSIVAGNSAITGPDINLGGGLFSGANDVIGVNPLLAPLGNYGGPTPTAPPLPGSPAINAASVIAGLTTDQRGAGFPRVVDSAPDIGAVETAYPPEIAVEQPAGVNLVDGTASLSFGTVNVGSGSAALVFTITNRGGGNLALTNLTTDGANPGDFIVSHLLSYWPLPASDFNSSNGGFTVTTPQPYEGPWTYSTGSWRENGQDAENGHPNISYLISPTTTITGAGAVELTFAHRWSFEPCCDGGTVEISVNGGAYVPVPGAAFTQNGYNESGRFTGESAGHASSAFIQSKATLGTFNAGDTLAVRFVAANDSNIRGDQPCWEITSYALTYSRFILAPRSSTTFTVQFVPTGTGARTATLHILSDDSDENPFDITLNGTGAGVNPVATTLAGATRLANGMFRFGFTNVTGASFTVFGTTNVALPFNQWSNLGPVLESPAGSGQFQFTDPQATNHPTRFYRVKSP